MIIPATELLLRSNTLPKMIRDGIEHGIEIILVLDGTPETEERIFFLGLGAEKDNIKVVKGVFGAPGLARNAGLSLCTNEWIAFWDCDDYPAAESFIELMSEGVRNKVQVVIGGFRIIESTSGKLIRNIPNKLSNFAVYPGLWRFVFKREIIKNLEFPRIRIGEDLDFLSQVLAKNPMIQLSNIVVYTYVVRSKMQLTSTVQKNEIKNSLRVIHEHMCILNLINVNSKAKQMLVLLLFRVRTSLFKYSNKHEKAQWIRMCVDRAIISSLGLKLFFSTFLNIALNSRR